MLKISIIGQYLEFEDGSLISFLDADLFDPEEKQFEYDRKEITEALTKRFGELKFFKFIDRFVVGQIIKIGRYAEVKNGYTVYDTLEKEIIDTVAGVWKSPLLQQAEAYRIANWFNEYAYNHNQIN